MSLAKILCIAALSGGTLITPAGAADSVAPAPNGIAFPDGYQDWRVVAVSHRTDNNTLRAIIGNDVAIAAAREGRTNPWPDGAILGKVVMDDETHASWPAATVPADPKAVEFMFKDTAQYAATGGWGYARWLGAEKRPYGENATFDQECFGCHTPMKGNDYVFTRPVSLP